MSGRRWTGTGWERAKQIGIADPAMGNAVRSMSEGWSWTGSGWVRIYANRRTQREDFNRADSSDIGTAWSQKSTKKNRIVSNAVQGAALDSNTGRQACGWNVYQGGAHGGRLHTDNNYIRAQLVPAPNQAANNYTAIGFSWPDTWGTGTMLYAIVSTGSGSELVTCTGTPNGPGGSSSEGSNQTPRASGGNVPSNALIELRRIGTAVTFWVNGTQTMSWTDTITSRGAANRRWGFQTEGNRPLFPATNWTSPGIDWIEAGDL